MTQPATALLAERGVVRVAGADAQKLLQGIITNDMELLGRQDAIHAALLTPQGKMLFEFFVVKHGEAYLLETARDRAADLVKRLTIYRLRAKVEFGDVSAHHRVTARWGSPAAHEKSSADAVVFADPRLPALGVRIIDRVDGADDRVADGYHAHRIALGVPEAGRDYVLGDTFPHEADLDQLNGISFSKGCFVGQEVVSRMQHRGGSRKRVVPVEGTAPLTSGSEVMAGAVAIGTVGSVAGGRALALLRLDRAAEAIGKGEALTANGVAVAVRRPDWATFELQAAAGATTP
jgi:tRNA-modifying protein YgfZ